MVKENAIEKVTIELAPSKELKRFDKLYKETGNNCKEMCKLAYDIVDNDTERKHLFIEHVIELGMSKQSGSQFLIAGRIYNGNPMLTEMSHTNIVELRKVTDDETGIIFSDFYTKTGTTPETLVTMSQKKIRELVKIYIGTDTEALEKDADTEAEATEAEETQETSTINITPLLEALAMSVTTLEIIQDRYKDDFERADYKLINDTMFEIRRAVKNMTKGE